MSKANMNWSGQIAVIAITMALVANTAAAGPLPVSDEGRAAPMVPSAASLLRFYPMDLASSPLGVVEDQEVWLAKVQGLIAGAPSWLQQNVLLSQTTAEFISNVALLQQMQEGMLKQSARRLQSQAKSGLLTTKALGDTSNLVYKTLEPCRIMDTRNATLASGVQGPISGGSLKNIPGFITNGSDWSAYGQTAQRAPLSDCGLNSTVGTNIKAVALVITILNPNFDAYLGVSDVNNLTTVLSTVALNYAHGQGLSTTYIVPQISTNNIYFAMPAGLSAQLIFDVVGYYAVSDATALDCTNAVASETVYYQWGFVTLAYPSCPSGYNQTGVYCAGDGQAGLNTSLGTSSCLWRGSDFGNLVQAISICCRVPGK